MTFISDSMAVSEQSREVCDLAVRAKLGFRGDPIAEISRLADRDDRCALAHIMRAIWLLLSGEKRHVVEAICSVRRAERYIEELSARERGLLQAARALARGQLSLALRPSRLC